MIAALAGFKGWLDEPSVHTKILSMHDAPLDLNLSMQQGVIIALQL